MIIILDVSAAQGRIDWDALAASKKCSGVILKATEGNGYVDPEFVRNYNEAKRVGLLFGVYHFAHPDRREMDARAEAEHFVSSVPGLDRIAYALDIEEARNIDKGSAFTEWVMTFCERVDELLGCKDLCGIYTGGPFWNEHDGEPDDRTRERLKRRWLWIAAYVNDPTKYIAMTLWCARGAVMHQRSGDVGPGGSPGIHYPGITHNVVDTNVFLASDDPHAWVESLWLDDLPIMFPETNVPDALDVVTKLATPDDVT